MTTPATQPSKRRYFYTVRHITTAAIGFYAGLMMVFMELRRDSLGSAIGLLISCLLIGTSVAELLHPRGTND